MAQARAIEEVLSMTVLGEILVERGMQQGMEKGIREMILDNLEEKIPVDRICEKLCRRFELSPDAAWEYIKEYSSQDEK